MWNPTAAPATPSHPPAAPRRSGPRGLTAAASLLGAALLVACGTHPTVAPEPQGAGSTTVKRPAPPRTAMVAPPTPAPRSTPYDGPDGPEPNPPPDLIHVPDAVPKVERLRAGSPNLPYVIRGQAFRPVASDVPVRERGIASWYGRKFHGQRTASGEVYNMYAMTAAHPTLPIPSYARVRNRKNGREVIVRINDRGPFKSGRIIDLSYTAGLKLGFVKGTGTAPVELERLTHEAIRTGSWRLSDPFADPPSTGRSDPAQGWIGTVEAPDMVGAEAAERATEEAWARFGPAWPTTPAPFVRQSDASTSSIQRLLSAQQRPEPAPTADARGWWLQLASVGSTEQAARLQMRLSQRAGALAPLLTTRANGRRHTLEAGPFPSRDEALAAAQRLPRSGENAAAALLQRQ